MSQIGIIVTLVVLGAILIGAGDASVGGIAAAAVAIPLIPRSVLFGSPNKASPQISPDGRRLAYLAPVDGVLNIWVGPADHPAVSRPVTAETKSWVMQYFWAYDSRHLLYLKDKDGDENHHLLCLDPESRAVTDLTPYDGVKAQVLRASHRRPNEILVLLNHRDKGLFDVHHIDLTTGTDSLVEQNPGYVGYLADDDYQLRFAFSHLPDGSLDILRRQEDGSWSNYTHVDAEDTATTGALGLDAGGSTLYMIDSRGRNTSAVTATDLATGLTRVLAEDPRADAEKTFAHPRNREVRAVAFNYQRRSWTIIDPSIAADWDCLKTLADGEIQVLSASLDDRLWVVGYMMDNGPYRHYLYDRSSQQATFLFTNRKALERAPLSMMHSRVIKTRDGLEMVVYFSLPVESDPDGDGVPNQPVPMILMPHGGPWGRDTWGYSPWHQWSANRGYAVLQPQFRGSTGFGKAFVNASNREWGAKMHDDLMDAVDWSVKVGIARRDKIGIMGASYGGYAALWALTAAPDAFACGVDVFGISNLLTLLGSAPAYWGPLMDFFYQRVGDPRTEEGKEFLLSRSPISHVDRIKKPLLIIHGANDVRATLTESEHLVTKMKEKKIPVTYVVFPDEGHHSLGYSRNSVAWYAVAEQFLARHLGGRAEPIGDDFEGSSIQVREGAAEVPGLAQALMSRK